MVIPIPPCLFTFCLLRPLFCSNIGNLSLSASMSHKVCIPLCLPLAKSASDEEIENETVSLRETMKDSLFVLFLDWKGSCGLSRWFVMPRWKLILSEAPTLTFRRTRESRVEGIGCSCMLIPHQTRLKARNPAQTSIYWEPRTGQKAGAKLHLVSVFVFHLSTCML